MKTPKILLFVLFIIVLTFSSFIKNDKQQAVEKFIVVLDAGHGGKDPGKLSKYGYKEKDIALKITLQVGAMLEKNPNIKVIYTRTTDVFIELKDRPKIANNAKADLFVSIHCNAHHTEASGTETFVLAVGNANQNLEVAKAENEVIYLEDDYEKHYKGFDPSSPESFMSILFSQEEYTDQSIMLASLIEKNFTSKFNRKSRGVKQASLWVIHQTAMPSVLIETGFVTNKEEGAYLNSDKGQTEISTAISNAILEYKHNLEGNVGDFVFKGETTVIKPNTESPALKVTENTILSDTPVAYKIQLIATSKPIEVKSNNFKGLKNVVREKEGQFFKYFYGNTSSYDDAKQLEEEAAKKGYKSCFIVAFKDGKKISLTEALKTTAN
ncbi:N-acetylmuramoyl-L-alanine amidase [Mariniflexile fucanivorans]|uniref:N-acetylmuramoyl-L-alanine amidase n=1 Tax=Mariniflexile fucanivorans TaxID=264023 RepID=A0A4R1RBG1_9FLAO|nr:N-acetylmuramoyl-L-alanine amidase [Mariniflexile fucanivorans]TCL63088.1 N-acetylmuramoyl-L-alanine amidase [Mariniflexile fucanivorans]